MVTLGIFAIVFVVCVVAMILAIKYDSVELDPKSPFFNDEIETEGVNNVKLKVQ
jgi:hypothetical protein